MSSGAWPTRARARARCAGLLLAVLAVRGIAATPLAARSAGSIAAHVTPRPAAQQLRPPPVLPPPTAAAATAATAAAATSKEFKQQGLADGPAALLHTISTQVSPRQVRTSYM